MGQRNDDCASGASAPPPGPDVAGVIGAIIFAGIGLFALVFGLRGFADGGWGFAISGVAALTIAAYVLTKALPRRKREAVK